MSESVRSRIPEILDNADAGIPNALNASTRRIAATARMLVAVDEGDLKRSIRVSGRGMSQSVLAGNKRVFWGHWVEWGTVHKGARPFMTPAAEAEAASGRLEREIRGLYD